ncbi:hypothetical protein [Polyangium spumosum]|uniref:Uncharacterized protein n=1 Tax=Polyangium spumosum TaxID=889282 RepID=A0A6N7PS67_9BACT|nr:hypothetical protein [Polyangium spumosum]MRG93666.1 hypothetical protein [Polyangium spumosum]
MGRRPGPRQGVARPGRGALSWRNLLALTPIETSGRLFVVPLQRNRTVLSVGLLLCATAALVPLGCAARIRHRADDRPRVPAATAERLRACVDELGGELERGYYTFDATVKIDEEGRVVDVKGRGVPHPELAICLRIALRGMTVTDELLRLRELRVPESAAPANGQAPDERRLVGNPAVAVAVVVVLADLFIEVGTTVVVLAAAVEMTGEIAETVRKKKDPCQEPLNDCLDSARQSRDGGRWKHSICVACHEQCKGNGKWPDRVMMSKWESCK